MVPTVVDVNAAEDAAGRVKAQRHEEERKHGGQRRGKDDASGQRLGISGVIRGLRLRGHGSGSRAKGSLGALSSADMWPP